MADKPIRIAITPPLPNPATIPDLANKITTLLTTAGWNRVHIRFPDACDCHIRELIRQIPAALWPRLTIHNNQQLATLYGCGIQLTGKQPRLQVPRPASLSVSCHSAADVIAAAALGADYATLSPVFNSISKPGYNATTFSSTQYSQIQSAPIKTIALGGISTDTIPLLPPDIFDGYAVLGALPWDRDIRQFLNVASSFTNPLI